MNKCYFGGKNVEAVVILLRVLFCENVVEAKARKRSKHILLKSRNGLTILWQLKCVNLCCSQLSKAF